MEHIKTGRLGETLAAKFLLNLGYKIIDRNYRFKRSEIDLVAVKENLLVFIEVKTRKNNHYGDPEEVIDDRKIDMILKGAEAKMEELNWEKAIRFDVISIILYPKVTIEHFEDAF